MAKQPNILQAKCVLVIGATAGIGRELALAIHDLHSNPTVVVAGRRQERLDELCKRSDRIHGMRVDMTAGRQALHKFVDSILTKHPDVSTCSRRLINHTHMTHISLIPAGRCHIFVGCAASLQLHRTREDRPRWCVPP